MGRHHARGRDAGDLDRVRQRLLGVEPEPFEQLGLEPTAIYTAVEQVGNYGEIYNRNLGPDTQFNIPRGLNAQWSDGGLIYGIPFR